MKEENKTKHWRNKKQGTIEIIKVSPLGLFFATVICASGSVCLVVLFFLYFGVKLFALISGLFFSGVILSSLFTFPNWKRSRRSRISETG